MISGALNGPSGCLQYDEGTTKRLVGYLTSMESCDMQDSNSTSYSGLKNPCNVWELWADCDAALDGVEISLSASVMK